MNKITISHLFRELSQDVSELIDFKTLSKESSSQFPFSSSKINDTYYINYSRDAANAEIKDIQELLEYLIIFCHELAHCLNKHNGYKTDSLSKERCLETHADHQGANMATYIYAEGKKFDKILANFNYTENKYKESLFCQNMAGALNKLYFDFYKHNTSSKYLPPEERIITHIMGIAACFFRNQDYLSSSTRYINILQGLVKYVDSQITNNFDASNLDSLIPEIRNTHQEIQGINREITQISNPNLKASFGTSYTGNIPRFIKDKLNRETDDLLRKLK